MSVQPDKNPKTNLKKAAFALMAIGTISLVGYFSYRTLSGLKIKESQNENTQEQFVGGAQISEQLQSECQKSVEKISSLSEAQSMFTEYKQNVENCREVYFNTEKKSKIRNEGMYPDIIVDIAIFAGHSNKPLAFEMLNFVKGISPWEFYMGPIVCNSRSTIEAYIESLSLDDSKICYKVEDKNRLSLDIKNRAFSVLAKSLSNDRVVSIGSPESEEGCPEKISTITKLVQDAAASSLSVEEEQVKNSSDSAINFVFKSKTEDKIILQFAAVNDCLQLQSVLISDLPTNE